MLPGRIHEALSIDGAGDVGRDGFDDPSRPAHLDSQLVQKRCRASNRQDPHAARGGRLRQRSTDALRSPSNQDSTSSKNAAVAHHHPPTWHRLVPAIREDNEPHSPRQPRGRTAKRTVDQTGASKTGGKVEGNRVLGVVVPGWFRWDRLLYRAVFAKGYAIALIVEAHPGHIVAHEEHAAA